MVNSWKNIRLDNIAFTSGDNFTHHFPAHFHEEYTIGVSVSGIQQFTLQDKSFMVEPHSIFLIKPHLIHAHFPVADLGWSFKSLYLSPDLMDHLLKSAGVRLMGHAPVLFQNQSLYGSYLRFHERRQKPDETQLCSFIKQFATDAVASDDTSSSIHPGKTEAIKHHLADHLDQKLSLDKLARQYSIDKYQLIRQFKQSVGVTPNTYLTILRIEKARTLISKGYPIVEAALEAGFYDQSHFHHNFVHYTGVTPGKFVTS